LIYIINELSVLISLLGLNTSSVFLLFGSLECFRDLSWVGGKSLQFKTFNWSIWYFVSFYDWIVRFFFETIILLYHISTFWPSNLLQNQNWYRSCLWFFSGKVRNFSFYFLECWNQGGALTHYCKRIDLILYYNPNLIFSKL